MCLVGGEQVLKLAGYPTEATDRVAHPPHFRELRKSIEFEHTFETNALGLRYAEIPVAKPAGEVRVFVVGDSFTEGHGVEARDTFAARLEAGLQGDGRRVRFINGGLSGTGPVQYGRVFLNIGMALQPDVLLICVYANDVLNLEPHTKPSALYDLTLPPPSGVKAAIWAAFPRTYLAARQAWHSRTIDPLTAIVEGARRRGLVERDIQRWRDRLPADLAKAASKGEFNAAMLADGLVPERWAEALDLSTASSRARLSAMLGVLTEIRRQARSRGIAPGLVFIPVALQYDARTHDPQIRSVWREVGVRLRSEWLQGETRVQEELRAWASSEGVPWLDLTRHLRGAVHGPARLTYALDEHWTPEGHAEAARALAPWLVDAGLLPGAQSSRIPHRR